MLTEVLALLIFSKLNIKIKFAKMIINSDYFIVILN